jgi:hypothetical protein
LATFIFQLKVDYNMVFGSDIQGRSFNAPIDTTCRRVETANEWKVFITATNNYAHNLKVYKTNLERFDVVSDDDQLSLLLLDERCHRVDAGTNNGGTLCGCILLALGALFRTQLQTSLLFLFVFRAILVEQTEQLCCCTTHTLRNNINYVPLLKNR